MGVLGYVAEPAEKRFCRRGAHWALVPALVCLSIAAWLGGLSGPYQFDDRVTPLSDPASQSLTAWVGHLPHTLRPLTKLTYAVEASLGWGAKPAPRRLVSILILALAGGALLTLLPLLTPRIPRHLAFVLALIWAVHPVHAENTLQVCGRPVVLSSLLLLTSLWMVLRDRPWIAAFSFVLAGLSRETALAGVVVLAAACFSDPGRSGRSIRRWMPIIASTLFLLVWFASTARYWELADYSYLGRPFLPSLSSQVAAIPVGLGLYWAPGALSIDYGVALPRTPLSIGFVSGIALCLAALAAMWIGIRNGSRALAVGSALWLAAVLPTQSLIPKLDALTGRPLSLALAGLLILSAPLVKRIAERGPMSSAAVLLAAALLAAWLGGWTFERQRLYTSELLLWRDAARKSAVNPRPHLYYALLLKAEGRVFEAKAELAKARDLDPFDSRIAALWKQMQQQESP